MKQKLEELKSLMLQGGFAESAKVADQMLSAGQNNSNSNRKSILKATNVNHNNVTCLNNSRVVNTTGLESSKSEETIYENAIKAIKQKRQSSSSEEDIDADSSSELLEINQIIRSFAANIKANENDEQVGEPSPLTSKDPAELDISAEDKANKLIRDAEAAKGKIFGSTGKKFFNTENARNMIHSVLVDKEYTSVGSHVDEAIMVKIRKGEYVDFAKLLPKDRIAVKEDHRLQPIFKDGQVFWQTPTETSGITSYYKWEQAFRVFSKIYTKFHPHRASELIQYSNDIHTASLSFTWDNVYMYDKEFRIHMGNHPMRSWTVILQHAWNLKMRDRLGSNHQSNHSDHRSASYNDRNQNSTPKGKILKLAKNIKIALCGLRWFKLNVSKCQKMLSCQKDVKCQIVKHLDYGGGSQKK